MIQRGFAPARNRLDDFVQAIRPQLSVGIQGHRCVRMSQHPLDYFDVGAGCYRHARGRVAQRLRREPASAQACLGDRFVPDPTAPVVDIDETAADRIDQRSVRRLPLAEGPAPGSAGVWLSLEGAQLVEWTQPVDDTPDQIQEGRP